MKRALQWILATVAIAAAGLTVQTSMDTKRAVNKLAEQTRTLSLQIKLAGAADVSPRHTDAREFTIRSQLSRVKNPIVTIGDSITEAALLPAEICQHQVINAGIGGSWTALYGQNAPSIFNGTRSALILVALGTNDSSPGGNARVFRESYAALLDELSPNTEKILPVGIPPTDVSLPLGKIYIDPALAPIINDTIASIAAERGLGFVDVRAVMATGILTVDGVHLNAAGYEKWTPAIVGGIAKALNCDVSANVR